jgi:hypothetical protein
MNATLVPIETRSRTRMIRVDRGTHQLGFIEKMPQDRYTITPWKAFAGIGAGNQYLGAFYAADGGKEAAVSAVLMATWQSVQQPSHS